MTVGEICSGSARVCQADTKLAEAAKTMWDADCGMLPVVDRDRKVTGAITDRDICLAIATRGAKALEQRAGDHVQLKLVTCTADEEVGAALKKMAKHQVRRLPVVDADGRIAGVFSLHDAVRQSGRFMGPRGAEVSPDALILVLQAIGESPDRVVTAAPEPRAGGKPGTRIAGRPTSRRMKPGEQGKP
ncbi:MAG: CBS domain-containing protein [Planctomycetes bacterium]|nr:CBS domain-containing protein [Planctomycetota bacterium]